MAGGTRLAATRRRCMMRTLCVVQLLVLGTAITVASLLAGVWGGGDTARPAEARVDWCEKLQQYTDAFNRGEVDLNDFADDMVFEAMPICDEVECVGKDAFRNYLESYVDQNARFTITGCEVSGNTMTTPLEIGYDVTRAAGVDRIIGGSTYEIEGDKIVAVRNLPTDMTDPQTAQFVRYWLAGPRPTLSMGPGRDADQSPGMAEMPGYPGFVQVFVRIVPGPAGVPQPIHIHEGTCANLGAVAFALRNVDGGVSHTILRGTTLSDLQTGKFAIAVQKSEQKPDVYVACGDIPAAAAEVPPAEPAPVPVATGFADANGARLYYEVYGEGEPLLLIPGLALNHLSWADEVPVYAPEFKVIVFDPRGTGQSSFPEGVEPSMALLADDAAALLDALGVDAAHVSGWSLGGMVAQEMALRHPEKIRSLILGAATPGGPHSVPSEDWAVAAFTAFLTQGLTAPHFLEALLSPAYLAEHRSEAIEYVERLNAGPATPLQATMAQVQAMTGHDTYDRLPSITAPTLVIHGTDDPLQPAENARILAERIPGAELILLAGARHAYGGEKPAEVHAAVLDFLRRHAGQVPAPAAPPSAGSGGLLGGEGSSLPTWWYALAAGGTLLVLGGLLSLRSTGNRR
jgi:pimeloyl-ACP methyl ester carboxylesterase